ncbi:putative ferric-chelate reductase 1 isoform X2 [Betta splendens]|uniref:Ferric-chelate reductase 1 isoform X2 n=1 Tax=Betta splendens TaxID=158456 RepID=A0A8M1H672_BETSP|nr:putative ferric-chelate reductase 1 isoform X2 [Betta splendens]
MSWVSFCCLFSMSAWCWLPAGCYSNGKVTKACGNMEPHHGGQGQSGPSPYRLTANASTFSPGDHIQVKLSGTTHFDGFLLQARDAASANSGSTVGTFTLIDSVTTQLLTCNKQPGSAVSHTSDAQQTEVGVIWNAPEHPPDEVQFVVTVVSHYKVFWVKLPGPTVYKQGVTPHPPESTTKPSVHTTTPAPLPGPFVSDGCGQSKSCLLDPPGCDPKEDGGCFFLSMTPLETDKSVIFELSGPAEGYIAFALSWDTWMGNDDVYMCIKDEDRVSVSAAVLSGRTHPDDQTQSGLSSVSWRLADGVIQCRFSRAVRLSNQEPGRYDLDQEYFLFLASGNVQFGKVWKHNRQPLISTHRKLITGRPDVLEGSRGPMLMKTHGAMMMLAWMLTGSVGTFVASFYKPDWPNQSLLGQKVWFQVHRGLMMLTVMLTTVAFFLPFFYRKAWSKHAGVHPYLGCCVLALSLTQPIMAVFRPPPDSHRRCIFNWAHWAVGSLTELMAVAAMFVGMHQSSLLLPSPWATHVLIGYVTWLASFRLLLLAQKHLSIKRSLRSDEQQFILSVQSEPSGWGSVIKSLILAVLALGNSAFLVALLSSVVNV